MFQFVNAIEFHRKTSSSFLLVLNNLYLLLLKTLPWIHNSHESEFGLMKIINKGRILSFSEKPNNNNNNNNNSKQG